MGLLDNSVNDKKMFNSGRDFEKERIIKLLEEADSACSEWAIVLIRGY